MLNVLRRTALAVVAVFATLGILELACRVALEVTDNVDYEHLPGVGLRLKPNQEGVYLREATGGGDRIKARFRVNNAGFNSARDYSKGRVEGRIRVAVIGDSFVEALQVDSGESFAQVMERELESSGLRAEVYSFGVSGNGTAQVYRFALNYILEYSPDLVVYLFVPNDVEDSSPFGGRNMWKQQYELGENSELVELEFDEYRMSGFRRLLRKSALFRYLYYQLRWGERVSTWKMSSDGEPVAKGRATSEVEMKAWRVVERLLQEFYRLLDSRGIPSYVVWQGDVERGFYEAKRLQLEEIVKRNEIPFYDLSADFARDYEFNGRWFRIKGDGHWNKDGHRVAGESMARLVLQALGGNGGPPDS